MKENLPKEKQDIFDSIIRNLRTALKNSVLYSPGHPVFDFSVKNLKTSLDQWFLKESKFNLGVSPDNLLLDGRYIKDKNDLYGEVADYLHTRGILAISASAATGIDELMHFFSFLKNDIKTIREKGGVVKNIPPTPHLKIKEVDYSALLASMKGGAVGEESDVWQSLTRIAEELKGGTLPESKTEFLVNFLKDPKKSASVLNKIYKEAVAKLKDDKAAKEIRETITKIYEYFEKNASGDTKKTSEDVAGIIARLDPNLVVRLFDEASLDGKEMDLAKEITKDFSDDFMADFITSLIAGEGSLNENLLKVFDRLLPGKSDSANVASLVADKLFEKKLLNTDILSQLQVSLKEIFVKNPENNFMSQMYKMTVDTFISKKTHVTANAAKLAPLAKEYTNKIDKGGMIEDEVSLLINLLWLETDAVEFKKFSSKFMDIFPDILEPGYSESIKEVFGFFTKGLRPEQTRERSIDSDVKDIVTKITGNKSINRIISFVLEAEELRLEDLAQALVFVKSKSAGLLMDAFVAEKDPSRRGKISSVLMRMKEDALREIEGRAAACDPAIAKDLFQIMKEASPDRAHSLIKGLLSHRDAGMRAEALNIFDPQTEQERDDIFRIFAKEKDEAIKENAASNLLRTQDKAAIEKLFKYAQGRQAKRRHLLRLIEICGQLKAQESLPYLKNIFLKRPLFAGKSQDEVRIAAIVSLRQLGTDEAMGLVREGLRDRRQPVRRMCGIIMELMEEDRKKTNGAGADGVA